MFRNCNTALALAVIAICIGFSSPCEAVISRSQRLELTQISGIIKKAGESFLKGEYDQSGKHVEEAQKRLKTLVESGDIHVYRAADPLYTKIGRAHALLELEGVSLKPFVKPAEPKAMPAPAPKPKTPPATPGTPAPTPPGEISFVKDVAPILVGRCGRCHVTGSKGDFSMANFTALMKGPPEGTVVFPGDAAGSRLIDVIASGSMPPSGNGIPRAELAKLAEWVTKGAKFDGPSPDAGLSTLTGGPTAQPARTPPPEIRKATGNETVSFAKDIAPILIENCSGCHIDAMRTQGGLNMDSFARLNRGGDSGPVVQARNAMMSLIVRRIKGEEGMRMPAGGRPALSDEQIQLISTWINEGAALDGMNPDQPLKVMAALAWAKDATHEELMERRKELATDNWKTGSPSEQARELETENFYVVGSVGPNTLKMVADQAELALSDAKSYIRKSQKPGTPFFKGRTSIFVFPRRYDYSEFGSMIEKRTLPPSWREHWRFDGVDAYAAVVVTPSDEAPQVKARLVGPLTSLTLAQMGDVPRWMSEGIGRAVAAKVGGQDFPSTAMWEADLPAAVSNIQKPEQFLGNKLPPEQADTLSYGIGKLMLDRTYRTKFDKFVRALDSGSPFDRAFVQSYGGQPKELVSLFGKWYAANGSKRRR